MSSAVGKNGITIYFGQYFARSNKFDDVFEQGMALVEKTARYLDSEGRKQAKALKPSLNVIYATESMRLTTRLLDLSSWLLVQRALKKGEISLDDALAKRGDLKFRPFGRLSHIKQLDQLPDGLQHIIRESYALSSHIHQIDLSLQGDADDTQQQPHANPVSEQQQLIEMRLTQAAQTPCNPI